MCVLLGVPNTITRARGIIVLCHSSTCPSICPWFCFRYALMDFHRTVVSNASELIRFLIETVSCLGPQHDRIC